MIQAMADQLCSKICLKGGNDSFIKGLNLAGGVGWKENYILEEPLFPNDSREPF